MGAVAYNRLSSIERETSLMLGDTLPGLDFSTSIRGACGETYVLGWETVKAGSDGQHQV